MIGAIIAWSAKHKFFVVFLTAIGILAAAACMKHVPLDAIPDLSDTQVIVYSRWDRSPDTVEDQVTYPIVTALLGLPKVKTIRGFSDFGFSYVYVIFDEGTDMYWARSRTVEYLSKIQSKLPEGVQTELGPDAAGVGWIYQYALVDKTGRRNLADLRDVQDWSLRYWLQSVPGVAEVASVGGFQKQYQVLIDPTLLSAYKIPLGEVVESIRRNNNDFGGRLIEFSGAEYMVRGRGYLKSVEDIENIVLSPVPSVKGKPVSGGHGGGFPAPTKPGPTVYVKNVAQVVVGPDIRRGVADLDGEGETVGGIIVMRQGENALNVIERVKQRLAEIKPSLPDGVEVLPVYDRSDLIKSAVGTLTRELIIQMIIVSLVILLFLWHIPSALVPILTIPASVALAFIPIYFLKLSTNIMSLAGLSISIGVLVDGAIVEMENAYKRLEQWNEAGRPGDYREVRLKALQEVGPSVFFSLLVIAVAFIPVFGLVDQEGRLFRPLALTKNITMAIAALLVITFDPAVRMMFTRIDFVHFKPSWLSSLFNHAAVGKYYSEENHPISKITFRLYEPACRFVLKHKKETLIGALLLVVSTIPVYLKLGTEFMPPLYEGSLLYMPTTLPGISVAEATKLLQAQDKVLKSFPEVERVFGKAGRAETATDPAPFSMMETTILLKPKKEWPKDQTKDELIARLDKALQFPGLTNAWTMPIRGRIDMLTTGVRTPVGIKISGADIGVIEKIGVELESLMKTVPGTRSVFSERAAGGYFLDFDVDRAALASYGLGVEDVEMTMMSAVGGEPVTTVIDGRARYTVNVRYAREFRDNIQKLKRVVVATPSGGQVPLGNLAQIRFNTGPSMIRNENGLLTGLVYIDIDTQDVAGYVKRAQRVAAEKLALPKGYALLWSGQYENILRVRERMKILIPITLFLIILLLYLNTGSAVKTSIVMLAVPFSMIGAMWYLHLLGYNMSIGVWVGLIALMGLDAETGVFMLLFLDLAYEDAVRKGKMRTDEDLTEAIVNGAVKRVRPKLMTVCATFMGLIPIMWSDALGSDLMKRIAAPLIGGLVTSVLLEFLVYPPIYAIWKGRKLSR